MQETQKDHSLSNNLVRKIDLNTYLYVLRASNGAHYGAHDLENVNVKSRRKAIGYIVSGVLPGVFVTHGACLSSLDAGWCVHDASSAVHVATRGSHTWYRIVRSMKHENTDVNR